MGACLCLLGWGLVLAHREMAPLWRTWFEVREVIVTGTVQVARAEVLERLGLTSEDTLLSVKASLLAERLESHPWIKRAEITRVFPHTLSVTITERQPAAVLRSSSLVLLLDEEGQVLSVLQPGSEPDLPLLVGMDASRLILGEAQSRQDAQAGIRLAELVGQDLFGRPELDWSDPSNVTATVNGVRFQFGRSAFEEKWDRYRKLQPVMRLATADARREIDLRFQNKVIIRERG
jgi:cell division protein FtsQ